MTKVEEEEEETRRPEVERTSVENSQFYATICLDIKNLFTLSLWT